MPHDHALLAQARSYRCRITLPMTREDKVRRRRQHLETQPLHRRHHRLATVDDLLTGLLEIGAILERRRGASDGDTVQRVGIDRKSTRLNSQSLMRISYAVFCLKQNTVTKN